MSAIPEYLRRLVFAFEQYPARFPPGEVSEQWIQHDHWCALLVQQMPCDCDPDIEIEVRGARYRISKDGVMTGC
jgi:hypothetical protein